MKKILDERPPPSELNKLLERARETIGIRDDQIARLKAELYEARLKALPTPEPAVKEISTEDLLYATQLERDSAISRLQTAQAESQNFRDTVQKQQIELTTASQQSKESQKLKDTVIRQQTELTTARQQSLESKKLNDEIHRLRAELDGVNEKLAYSLRNVDNYQDINNVMRKQLASYHAKEEEREQRAERLRRRLSDSDDDPIDTANKEKDAALEAKRIAEEDLRKMSTLYNDTKKAASKLENEAKSNKASSDSIRDNNRRLLADIEAYKARESSQRLEIDTLNNTIADIRHEREMLKADYDSLEEDLEDNESKLNAAREQRENLQREYTELLAASAKNQRLSEANKASF